MKLPKIRFSYEDSDLDKVKIENDPELEKKLNEELENMKKEEEKKAREEKMKEEEEKMKLPVAEEITICPPEDRGEVKLNMNVLNMAEILTDMVVEKGTIFSPPKKKSKASSHFEDFFGQDFDSMFFSDIEFYVLDTKPEGRVRVTPKTKIKFLDEFPSKYGFRLSKTIKLKKPPIIDKLSEVDNVSEIDKLSKVGILVSSYEDDKKIILVADKFYFIIKK